MKYQKGNIIYKYISYIVSFFTGESICNASGLGFNGVDKTNKPQWNKLTTVKPLQIEVKYNFVNVYLG